MQKNALSISKGRNRASSQIKETAYSNAKDTIIGIGFTQQSAVFGGILGEITGAIMGTLTGAITMNLTGILMGFTAGVMLGALAGSLIGIAVSQTAGSNGGPSIGAFTGMVLGPILGTIIGLFIPDSIRMSASTLQIPVLNAITSSRFETVSLFAFLFCILGTLVGVWVSGKNYKPQK
ncbi:MAG TPA: hypothetical protein PKV19_06590 [Anaerolineales bacterium]|nr:hypothetical protein [Anaerolineales bacterium]